MHRSRRLIGLVAALLVLSAVVAACGNSDTDGSGDNSAGEAGPLGLFDWDRDPSTIVVRLDSRPDQESPAFLLNQIPPCTLWGDGRLVWTTFRDTGEEDVLEARISDDAVRRFIEDIVARGFYDWEDELLPPTTTNPVIESITVALYGDVKTVRRFSLWPQNAYPRILETCQQLAEQPVRVLPDAGWVSAYPIPRDPQAPSWLWPPDAPFTLQELADSGEARWIEGNLAQNVWLSAREDRGNVQVLERGGGAYSIAITVPGISRDSLAAPEAAPAAE